MDGGRELLFRHGSLAKNSTHLEFGFARVRPALGMIDEAGGLHLGPAREDPEDRRQHELGRRIERIPENAMQALCRYAWPGNIRELGNVIERALILSQGSTLQLDGFAASQHAVPEISDHADAVERAHFVRVLERCGWRITGHGNAAESLGLRPSTLRSRLKKLGVARPGSIAPH